MRPEHTLLLAAAADGRGEAQAAVEAALADGLDWTRAVELALAHQMAPALLAALERADRALVPADILEALQTHCDRLRQHSDALVAELFALLDAFERESIAALSFKGPLLGELVFGDRGRRAPGDLDILVSRPDVPRVCELLQERGYRDAGGLPLTSAQHGLYRRLQCEYVFERPSDGMVVEPHWGLTHRALAVDVDYDGMLSRARPRPLCGRPVRMLAPADLLLALCIHGSKHRWERLAWIRDVSALLASCPDLDLDACVASARQRGCQRLLLVGLALARECGGAALPAAVDRRIDADPQVGVLAHQVADRLFDPVPPPALLHDRVDRFRLHMRERGIDRLRYVMRTWLWPGRRHLEIVALPASLGWAYFPLKWAHDFVVLPMWRVIRPRRA